jgi:beta-galactosidase
VSARVVDGRTLYVNTTAGALDVPIAGRKDGVISGRTYNGVLRLEPYEVDLLE